MYRARVFACAVAACAILPSHGKDQSSDLPVESPRLALGKAGTQLVQRIQTLQSGPRLHVTVDKPLYHPGDTVWARSWNLDPLTLEGAEHNQPIEWRLLDPRGREVQRATLKQAHGGAHHGMNLPKDAHGGTWSLRIETSAGHQTQRDIAVRQRMITRHRVDLRFERRGYQAGDDIVANAIVTNVQGEPVAGKTLDALVHVDGSNWPARPFTTNERGESKIRFTLPKSSDTQTGSLTVLVADDVHEETFSEALPLVQGRRIVRLLPEGGDLVTGLTSRVYVAGFDQTGEPADVQGRIVDQAGHVITTFRTAERGLGMLSLTPKSEHTYHAEVDSNAGEPSWHPLPLAMPTGCVLRHLDGDTDVRVSVTCTHKQRVHVLARQRGKVLDHAKVLVEPGKPAIVKLSSDEPVLAHAEGVATITVWDASYEPIAERLVYRNREEHLHIALRTPKKAVRAGTPASVEVLTTNGRGEPVPAQVSLSRVRDAVLGRAQDHSANLHAAMVLSDELAGPVFRVNDYLDGSAQPATLDLVLGTKGWRRFEWMDELQQDALTDASLVRRQPEAVPETSVEPVIDRIMEKDVVAPKPKPKPKPSKAQRAPSRSLLAGNPIILGSLNRSAIQSTIDRSLNRLRYCYRRQLQQSPGLGGKVVVSFVIHSSGQVSKARVARSTLQSRRVEACLLRVFGRMVFTPTRSGGLIIVSYPLVFSSTGGEHGPLASDARYQPPRPFVNTHLTELPAEAKPSVLYNKVRVFKAPVSPSRALANRETLAWAPAVLTDASGRATLDLTTHRQHGSFRVFAHGVGANQAGAAQAVLTVQRPLTLHAAAPPILGVGDELDLSIAATSVDDQEAQLQVTLGGSELFSGTMQHGKAQLRISSRTPHKRLPLRLRASRDHLHDEVVHNLIVEPNSFEHSRAAAGLLRDKKRLNFFVHAGNSKGLTVDLTLYPSALAQVSDGLTGLLRRPSGCFEQTTSKNALNVAVLRLLRASGRIDLELEHRAISLLEHGTSQLEHFESPTGGMSWHGSGPGHPLLTAYGLRQIADTSKVHRGSDVLQERMARWLRPQLNEPVNHHRFGLSVSTRRAYLAGAVSSSGAALPESVLRSLEANVVTSTDAYGLALTAPVLHAHNRPSAERAIDRLLTLQRDDGSFHSPGTSVMGSRGSNLHVETTAIALRALLTVRGTSDEGAAALNALHSYRRVDGTFGATQATALAMHAITEWAQATRSEDAGSVIVKVNGKVTHRLTTSRNHGRALHVTALERALVPGDNVIQLVRSDGSELPYLLSSRWSAPVPNPSLDAPLLLHTSLSDEDLTIGQRATLVAQATNTTDLPVASPMVHVGIPAGAQVDKDVLDGLNDHPAVASWELHRRTLILYLHPMDPKHVVHVSVPITAATPGRFTAPASSAYAYYADDDKTWSPGHTLQIRPASQEAQ